MKLNLLIIFFCTSYLANAQSRSLEDKIQGISTLIITTSPGISSQGTGFFFEARGPENAERRAVIEKLYLVTNRHVVLLKDKKGKEYLPETFQFHLRKVSGDSSLWVPIGLKKTELIKRLKIHPNPLIDVAVIEIFDLVKEALKKDPAIVQWTGVAEREFADNISIDVEATDEIIAIGYPRGYYDEYNIFPVVKSGTLASKWGKRFNNNPYFIVDIKLFPGSSGSLIISKPSNYLTYKGEPFGSTAKEYAFLGIYSGDPYQVDSSQPYEFEDMFIYKVNKYDVGVVWYANLVPEIIKIGIYFK